MADRSVSRPRSVSDRILNVLLAIAVLVGVWVEDVARQARLFVPSDGEDDERVEGGDRVSLGDLDESWHEAFEHSADPLTLIAIVGIPAAVAILLRTRWPLPAVLVSGMAALLGALAFGTPVVVSVAFAFVLYSLAVEKGWLPACVASLAAVLSVIAAAAARGDFEDSALAIAVFCLAAIVTPLLAAAATRSRRAYLQAVETQLQQAQAEQQARTDQALAQDRVRLAHDLHDVLAHSLTVVNMQVGVAQHLLADHPDRAQRALDEAQVAGSAAVAELRNTLALLRGADAAQLAPQPTLGDLEALFAGVRAAGLPLTTEVKVATSTLPAGISLIGYRTVQEGLTNVVKHAGPQTPTTVRVATEGERLHITITNSHGSATSSGSPGIGLEGLRSRIAALGGQLRAKSLPSGGFELDVTLPIQTDVEDQGV